MNKPIDSIVPRFTLGLSLAGGISTGAYIAGALDFIVEALDAFEKAKQGGDPGVPNFDVVVKAVCGASAGALNAATLAAALKYDFPHPDAATDGATAACNPLFDSWVNMTGYEDLLGSKDGDDGLKSLLDATSLEKATRKVIDFGQDMPGLRRRWIADPLHIAFTVTNLAGVPFRFGALAPDGLQMRMHADVLRFSVSQDGRACGASPDEASLTSPADPLAKWDGGWSRMANAALASAAFPVLLPPRTVLRPSTDYNYIDVMLPGSVDRRPVARRLQPAFDLVGLPTNHVYEFEAADGGLIDNDPVDVTRAILNDRDMLKSTPRNGDAATQAVLMIDPLGGDGRRPSNRAKPESSLASLASLFTALIEQARFRPVELALAQQENVFSRFVISPLGNGPYGTESSMKIAGASCGGFGGYLSRDFRKHDFLLGRHDAQRYLAEQLVLPRHGCLSTAWDALAPEARERYVVNARGDLPIIPLIGDLHPRSRAQPLPEWPRGAADLEMIRAAVDMRLDFIWRNGIESIPIKKIGARLLRRIVCVFWNIGLRARLAQKMTKVLRRELYAHDLMK